MTNPVTQRTNTLDQWRINLNTIGNNVGDPAGLYSTDGSDSFVLPNANILVAAINDLNTRKVKRSGDTITNLAITTSLTIGTTLGVAGIASITNNTASTTPSTGALVVTGGVGIGGALNIAGTISLLNSTASSSTTTGALVVTGGVGIGGAVNIGGVATLSNATASSSTTTGALVVTGGVGIGGAVNIGGAVAITGALTVAASGGVTAQSFVATNTGYTPGSFGANVGQGTVVMAKTGTTYDFSIINPGNTQYIMTVPTGTFNVNFPGSVSIVGTLSIASAVTFNQVTVNGALSVTNTSAFSVSPNIPTQAITDNSTYAINSAWLRTYFTPINITGAVSDVTLQVGQTAYINAVNAPAIPLHIACGDGQVYQVYIGAQQVYQNPGITTYIQPNNLNYGAVFVYRDVYGSGSSYAYGSAVGGQPYMYVTVGGVIMENVLTIWTSTLYKRTLSVNSGSTTVSSYQGLMACEWSDTTTPWTSLGTIQFGGVNISCQVVIKRIA